jgi:hypothetical protein
MENGSYMGSVYFDWQMRRKYQAYLYTHFEAPQTRLGYNDF